MCIGVAVPFVSDAIPLIGKAITVICSVVPLIGDAITGICFVFPVSLSPPLVAHERSLGRDGGSGNRIRTGLGDPEARVWDPG